jgi:uncharacterized protein YllA (UPF0747 family)
MSMRTDPDELASITAELADVVAEVCEQIKLLKEERLDTTGEAKDAYTLVIKNKVWILQQLIGTYSNKTVGLELDKEVQTVDKEVQTVEVPMHKDTSGPTGCSVEVVELGGENGPTGS